MIWVADSGSTKTEWVLVDSQGVVVLEGMMQGLNPHLLSDNQICRMLSDMVATFRDGMSRVDRVSFYGAGCGSDSQQSRMKKILGQIFKTEDVSVNGDMIGACRAVAPDNRHSFVAILGTGSNVCRYDGRNIVSQKPSLGYILADEGSGNCLGKRLLKDYLLGRMPYDLSLLFAERFSNPEKDFLDHIYHQPTPNRYLAAFAPFAYEHRNHPYVQSCVCRNFASFFVEAVLPIADIGALGPDDRIIYFVGGMAHAFDKELRQVATDIGFTVGDIVDKPLSRMVEYELCH